MQGSDFHAKKQEQKKIGDDDRPLEKQSAFCYIPRRSGNKRLNSHCFFSFFVSIGLLIFHFSIVPTLSRGVTPFFSDCKAKILNWLTDPF